MNDDLQHILDELSEAIGDDEDFAPPPTPASAASQAAAARREDAERKRHERAVRRGAGIPDSRSVDVAIAGALAEILRGGGAAAIVAKAGSVDGMKVCLKPVLARAIWALMQRGVDKRIAAGAIQGRLLRA